MACSVTAFYTVSATMNGACCVTFTRPSWVGVLCTYGHVARRFLHCQRGSEDTWQKQQTLFQIALQFIQCTSAQYTHCVCIPNRARRFVRFQSGTANIRRAITEIWQQLSPAIKFISLVFYFIIETIFLTAFTPQCIYTQQRLMQNGVQHSQCTGRFIPICCLPGSSAAVEFKQQRWCDCMLDKVAPKLTSVEHRLQTLSPLQCQASVMLNSPHHILHSVGGTFSHIRCKSLIWERSCSGSTEDVDSALSSF